MKKHTKSFILAGAAFMVFISAARGEVRNSQGIFGLYIENDVFAGSDGGYSNGVKFVWVSSNLNAEPGKGRVPRWLDSLSRKWTISGRERPHRYVSVFFGQNIYTPEDILSANLILNDRPYAGYTYAGLGFHSRDRSTMDTVELEIGIVGPDSFAGNFQKFLHRTFGWDYPRGWAHQLKDEPVLGVYYDHKWRIRETCRVGNPNWDFFAHSGAGLSNIFIGAGAGIELRAGWNLPDDFGTALIRPGDDCASLYEGKAATLSGRGHFGLHFFLALEGRAVARDLFLDGNTFRASPSIKKKPLTAEIAAGVAVRHKRFRASFCFVYQTKTFKGRYVNPYFGSLNFALNY